MDQTNKDDPKYTVRQLKVNLPQYVLDEIRALAKQANVPQGILIRNAYALAKVYYDETQAGNRMTISDSDDVAIKEIILPE